MKRELFESLIEWKDKKGRKPLLLKGARQVGKTHLLKELFGPNCFPDTHYFNFQKESDLIRIFEADLDPKRILLGLEIRLNKKINLYEDLVIFDEIQDCPRAITSLKYFKEELPELALACAGSHIGLRGSDEAFPVGQVDFLYLYPMNFNEFLREYNPLLSKSVDSFRIFEGEALDPFIHRELLKCLRYYFFTGGLPEVVSTFLANQNESGWYKEVRDIQEGLIEGYISDFSKYSGKQNSNLLQLVFNNVPIQLKNYFEESVGRFKFKEVLGKGSRYSKLEGPINWLVQAGLLIKNELANKIESSSIRQFSKESRFKLFLFDIGLLNCMMQILPNAILNEELGTYSGYMVENYLAQELYFNKRIPNNLISYETKSNQIDFLIEGQNGIVPIEAKSSSKAKKAKSLTSFIEKFRPSIAIKISGENYYLREKESTKLIKLPLYLSRAIKGLMES